MPEDTEYMTTIEASKVSGKAPQTLRRLCNEGRIPGCKQVLEDGLWKWKIPRGFQISKRTGKWNVLSEEQKNSIARQYKNGEKTHTQLADEYDIDPSYPRKLVQRGYPHD